MTLLSPQTLRQRRIYRAARGRLDQCLSAVGEAAAAASARLGPLGSEEAARVWSDEAVCAAVRDAYVASEAVALASEGVRAQLSKASRGNEKTAQSAATVRKELSDKVGGAGAGGRGYTHLPRTHAPSTRGAGRRRIPRLTAADGLGRAHVAGGERGGGEGAHRGGGGAARGGGDDVSGAADHPCDATLPA